MMKTTLYGFMHSILKRWRLRELKLFKMKIFVTKKSTYFPIKTLI